MALNKFSKKSDQIMSLYRAAYYIAIGVNEVGLSFLKKSKVKFPEMDLSTDESRKYWAEKILDKYTQMKIAS